MTFKNCLKIVHPISCVANCGYPRHMFTRYVCHIRQPTCFFVACLHPSDPIFSTATRERTWRMWCFLKPWRELRWIPKLRKSKNLREKKRSRWGEVSRIPRQTPKFSRRIYLKPGATIKNGRRFLHRLWFQPCFLDFMLKLESV